MVFICWLFNKKNGKILIVPRTDPRGGALEAEAPPGKSPPIFFYLTLFPNMFLSAACNSAVCNKEKQTCVRMIKITRFLSFNKPY